MNKKWQAVVVFSAVFGAAARVRVRSLINVMREKLVHAQKILEVVRR